MPEMSSFPEVAALSQYSTSLRKRWAIVASFAFSLLLVGGVMVAIALSSPANASTYALTMTGTNWTDPSSWTCTAGGSGSTGCGAYPGDTAAAGAADGDIANLSYPKALTVDSAIGKAVTMNNGAANLTITTNGVLGLVGTSSVSSSGGFLLAAGGTLNNNGSLTFSSFGTQAMSGGSIGGTGTININSTFALTGATGTMTLGSGQTLNNSATINYSAGGTNSLVVDGLLDNLGTFSISGSAPINGTGTILNDPAGSFSSGFAGTTTVNPVFNNGGNVTEGITGAGLQFLGGGSHTGTFSDSGTGLGFKFGGGTHSFNGVTFSGTQPVQNLSGGTFALLSNLTVPNFVNDGSLTFSTSGVKLSSTTFQQSATGSLSPGLDSAAVYNAVNVSGAATLGGNLTPSLNYTPANGDAFNVTMYSSHIGGYTYTPLSYPGGRLLANNGASAFAVVATPLPDLLISKSDNSPVYHGGNIIYTVVVTNKATAGASATNVTMTDTLPGGVTFVSAGPGCGFSAGTVTCTVASLAVGSNATFTITVTPGAVGSYSNTASVTETEPDLTPSDNSLATPLITNVQAAADLTISKTDLPDPVNAGATLTYTLNVSNGGPDPAASVTVTDPLPAGTTFVNASGTGWTCSQSAGTVQCTVASLAVGAAPAITITVTAPTTPGSITNTASVSATTFDPGPNPNSSSAVTTVNPSADLSITKTASPEPVTISGTLTYNLSVSNAGPNASGPITVTDPLPAGTTFGSASGTGWTCTQSAGTVQCTLPTLANATTANPISIVVTAPSTPGTITNTATVSSSTFDPTTGPTSNNVSSATSTVANSADLGIGITDSPDPVNAGASVTYTATISNAGPGGANAPSVTFTPSGGTITGVNGGSAFACSFTPASASCTFNTAVMANGASSPIAVAVTAGTGATMSLTGTVSSTTSDPTPGNNNISQSTTITPNADLAITKTGPANVTPGTNVTYSYSVTNNGPSVANNVTVSDPTPANATFFSATAPCATGFPCNVGTLNAGQTVNFSATYALSSSATSLSNTAGVSSAGLSDLAPSNNSSTVTSTVTAVNDYEVIKTGPATTSPGASISYNISVKNLGPSDALSSVTVSDPTPTGLSLVSVSGSCSSFPCTVGPLAAGVTASIVANYTVTATSGSITNTASVPIGAGDPVSTNNSSSVTTTVTPKADLSISKTGPRTVGPGGAVSFIITVTNNGPSDAANVVVTDPTPTGLAFIGNTGACTTPFPCNLGTMLSGTSKQINAQYTAGSNVDVTNTASVSTSTTDPQPGNNSASWNVGAAITCPSAPVQFGPGDGAPLSGSISWSSVGADSYDVFFGPAGTGCQTPYASLSGTSVTYSGLTAGTTYESRIVANKTGCPSRASACVQFKTVCSVTAPSIGSPTGGTVASPVKFEWSRSPEADKYTLYVGLNGALPTPVGSTSALSLTVPVDNGAVQWFVVASSTTCDQTGRSSTASFNVCSPPAAPEAGVVGAPTSGQPYALTWPAVAGAVRYIVAEATNAAFTDASTSSTPGTSVTFTHSTTTSALEYFYRVTAIGSCTDDAGPASRVVRVVILPPPARERYPNFDIPAGTQNPVTVRVFIEGDPAGAQHFSISLDKPWLVSVSPSEGTLPPEGITVNLTIDPSKLPNGTFTGTLVVTLTPVGPSTMGEAKANKKSVPVTVNLVTPVTPTAVSGPNADSIIIPAVGRLTGINSQWRSDVRIFNGSSQALKYQLDFLPSEASESKRTTLSTAAGDTTALDDVIHNWYGFGEVGDNASGILQIQPLTTTGTPPPSSSLATVVSSRTYNNTATSGTLGQYIPGIAYRNFIGRQVDASKPASVLSLQQLAQSSAFRTNVGLIEASGNPATVLLSVLGSNGNKLTSDFTVELKAGQQLALNSLLASKGITTSDARLEVRVTGGEGKVSAYASVVDNSSLDPMLVSPVLLGQTSAQTYVVPGVADLNNGSALWRTDLRILNAGSAVETVNLLFYPQGNAGNPLAAALTVNPGEVKALDGVLASLFGTTNTGGAVHVNTAAPSQLVVTGRTFNQTSTGTLGQFIPAATLSEGIDRTSRALNILQVEDSVRYRTNVGIAEMSGQSATVEVSINLPDSKVTPTVQIPLVGNEFRQLPLSSLGMENIYNARVSIRVIDGNGRVTAYGSVIDQITSDPTFVPAQQ